MVPHSAHELGGGNLVGGWGWKARRSLHIFTNIHIANDQPLDITSKAIKMGNFCSPWMEKNPVMGFFIFPQRNGIWESQHIQGEGVEYLTNMKRWLIRGARKFMNEIPFTWHQNNSVKITFLIRARGIVWVYSVSFHSFCFPLVLREWKSQLT